MWGKQYICQWSLLNRFMNMTSTSLVESGWWDGCRIHQLCSQHTTQFIFVTEGNFTSTFSSCWVVPILVFDLPAHQVALECSTTCQIPVIIQVCQIPVILQVKSKVWVMAMKQKVNQELAKASDKKQNRVLFHAQSNLCCPWLCQCLNNTHSFAWCWIFARTVKSSKAPLQGRSPCRYFGKEWLPFSWPAWARAATVMHFYLLSKCKICRAVE